MGDRSPRSRRAIIVIAPAPPAARPIEIADFVIGSRRRGLSCRRNAGQLCPGGGGRVGQIGLRREDPLATRTLHRPAVRLVGKLQATLTAWAIQHVPHARRPSMIAEIAGDLENAPYGLSLY